MHGKITIRVLTAVLGVAAAACTDDPMKGLVTREQLANGTLVVRYSAVPVAVDTAETDLVIGKVEGEEWETFGRIRGLAADAAGRVYVLDQQASAVRVFAPTGAYIRSLGGPGAGPGEIREANGILSAPDGNLWVQDHGAWALLVLSPEGRELDRHEMLYPGYGIEWLARIDTTGLLRQAVSHSHRAQGAVVASGVYERRASRYVKSFHPQTGTYDSAQIGDWRSHYVRIDQGGGRYMSGGVPYGPQPLVAFGPDGSTWTASSDSYHIARVGSRGDTTLMLQATVPYRPLSAENQDVVRNMFQQAGGGATPEAMPKHRPVLARLIVDDGGRLWVQRADTSSTSLFDVYDAAGDYIGSLRTRVGYALYPSPVVANGKIYGMTMDSLDVAYITRSAIPERFQERARRSP